MLWLVSEFHLLKAEHFIVCIDHILSIHPFDFHLGCFRLLEIVNIAAINVNVEMSIRVPAFNFRIGIAGSW